MNNEEDRKLREFLRANLPGMDAEPRRDLWPRMLRRLEERARPAPWFDWALVGAALMWLLLFPKTISVLLYHL
jgi:hypothetical protein